MKRKLAVSRLNKVAESIKGREVPNQDLLVASKMFGLSQSIPFSKVKVFKAGPYPGDKFEREVLRRISVKLGANPVVLIYDDQRIVILRHGLVYPE